MPGESVTIALISLLAGVLVSGFFGGLWLSRCFSNLKSDMLAAIRESRAQGDIHIEKLARDIRANSERMASHELRVEREFLRKDSAEAAFLRMEKSVDSLASDLRKQLAKIEGWLAPDAIIREARLAKKANDSRS